MQFHGKAGRLGAAQPPAVMSFCNEYEILFLSSYSLTGSDTDSAGSFFPIMAHLETKVFLETIFLLFSSSV